MQSYLCTASLVFGELSWSYKSEIYFKICLHSRYVSENISTKTNIKIYCTRVNDICVLQSSVGSSVNGELSWVAGRKYCRMHTAEHCNVLWTTHCNTLYMYICVYVYVLQSSGNGELSWAGRRTRAGRPSDWGSSQASFGHFCKGSVLCKPTQQKQQHFCLYYLSCSLTSLSVSGSWRESKLIVIFPICWYSWWRRWLYC